MHESVRSLRWSWIAFGWFIAIAVTSLILLALEAFGIVAAEVGGEALWVSIALAIGFLGAGLLVGTRVAAAPMLHGIAMGIFSLVAWLVVNLFIGEPTGEATWRSLDALTFAGLLTLQTAAAMVGTRAGVRWVRSLPG